MSGRWHASKSNLVNACYVVRVAGWSAGAVLTTITIAAADLLEESQHIARLRNAEAADVMRGRGRVFER